MQITELKGIGKKTAELFDRLSVYTTQDLVRLYPRDYDVYKKPVLISGLDEYIGDKIAVEGQIARKTEVFTKGKLTIVTTFIKDGEGEMLKCTWYNMPFLKKTLKLGARFIFRGIVAKKQNVLLMEQPQMYTIAQYNELMGNMQPVYPLTKGLSNKTVSKAVRQALEEYKTGLEKEYIPENIRQHYELCEHNFAMNAIHFPRNMDEYVIARKRLSFEEFFLFILAIRRLKDTNDRLPNSYVISSSDKVNEFIERLPYKLTAAQLKAWEDIRANMSGEKLMSRLVQGDVGSGKTIIAVLAMLNCAYAGYQSAMMVPTEVLAKQHYESLRQLLEENELEFNVSILTGSMTAAQKRKEYERIASGETDFIIGTHALIQEKVEYKKLALVITDEQHRFGVNQRKQLARKGHEPHVLVMSATPIPRTLAIIIYGDLDISVIDELPADRLPIKNCVVDSDYRERAYKFIEQQVSEGRQAYVICPLVEESEGMEAENVTDYAKKLKNELSPSCNVGILHGKMKAAQKNDIMEKFYNNEIQVLVSTTVIEVGVNVPNATVMMVENADRFGLAQLHQLRGRVGRGKNQSYCIFVSGNKSKKTRERLEILNKTNDGFAIAKEDLKLRGPGDFFGVRQSGDMDWGIADIYTDARTLQMASEAAQLIDEKEYSYDNPKNKYLADKVSEYTLKCLDKLNI